MSEHSTDDSERFWCPNCGWEGVGEDVIWGNPTPLPDYALTDSEPSKSDCPECGSLVEHGSKPDNYSTDTDLSGGTDE